MACPPPADEVERRFLEALGAMSQYTFLAGRLALSGMTGSSMARLLFSASAAR